MKIPQITLDRIDDPQRRAVMKAIKRVVDRGWYVLGQEVLKFENAFASYCNVKQAIGVANGTDAIEVALRAMKIGTGDRVVTVSHTAGATVAAIERAGAVPVLVDVDPRTYTISPVLLENCLKKHPLKSKIKAVIPVHLYGYPVDVQSLMALAEEFGVFLIEDCAQAHGAVREGVKVGANGHCGAFSFYPTKNLGAIGDGGILVTNDESIAEKARMIRQYGWKERFHAEIKGVNSRLDEIQAAILSVRLKLLEAGNRRRTEIANYYNSGLKDIDIVLPPENTKGIKNVYHQYVIRTKKRDALRNYLLAQGIGTEIHYPRPVHLQSAFRRNVDIHGDGLPNTECLMSEILSLPMFPEMADKEVEYVVNAIRTFFNKVIE